MSPDIYVYLEEKVAALQISVVVYKILGDVDIDRIKSPSTAKEYLNELEQKQLIAYEHSFLDSRSVETLGLKETAFYAIDYLIAKLAYEQQIKDPRGYRSLAAPPNYNYPLKPSNLNKQPLLWVGRQIAYYKRQWWAANIWHKRYPQYGWDKNYGLICDDHVKRCLIHGPVFNVHHMDFIQSLPIRWANLLRKYDLDMLLGENLHVDKSTWWWKTLGGFSFTDNFTKHGIKRMSAIATGVHEDWFKKDLDKDIKEYLYDPHIREEL